MAEQGFELCQSLKHGCTGLFLAGCLLDLIYSRIFLIKSLKVGEAELFRQGRSASEGQNQDSDKGGPDPMFILLMAL